MSKLLFLFFLCASLHAQIILTEIMYDSDGPESSDEFIEIYNIGAQGDFELNSILIGDQNAQEPLKLDGPTTLSPGQFAVIFDTDYDSTSGSYHDIIPPEALVLSVDDKTLGSGGLSNSTAETILLLSIEGDTLDSYTYTLGNSPGHSDERRDALRADSPADWQDAEQLNGTPGYSVYQQKSMQRFMITMHISKPETGYFRMNEPIEFEISITDTGSQAVVPERILLKDGEFVLKQFDQFDVVTDSIKIKWTPFEARVFAGAVIFEINSDGDIFSDSLNWSVNVDWPTRALMLNEVMAAPVDDEPEWIEVKNHIETPVDLKGWQIQDASGRTGTISSENPLLVQPNEYVILSRDEPFPFEKYHLISSKVIPISGFPSLNNSGDNVKLLGWTGAPIDSFDYSQNTTKSGISLERISEALDTQTSSNWNLCVDSPGATPGVLNSLSPKMYDARIDTTTWSIAPTYPIRDEEVQFSFRIENSGLKPVKLTSSTLFIDFDRDQDFSNDEIIFTDQINTALAKGDQLAITSTWLPVHSGWFDLKVEIVAEKDDLLRNNKMETCLFIGFHSQDVIINEVMPRPLENEPEWIELFIPERALRSLKGWSLSDARTEAFFGDQTIQNENGFVLISQNEASINGIQPVSPNPWPSLNNAGDSLILKDVHGTLIDHIVYESPNDLRAGNSLERILPNQSGSSAENWDVSADAAGATPGKKNSLFIDKLPASGSLSISPNPFSPDDDGWEDHALISYQLPMRTNRVNLFVFDMAGRRVHEILNNAHSGPERKVIWNGKDKNGHPLDLGMYILFLEAIDADRGKIQALKEVVVIAKK